MDSLLLPMTFLAEQSLQNADLDHARLQTVQTVQTEYFFSNNWLAFFPVLRLQSNVEYALMFVVYPQAA